MRPGTIAVSILTLALANAAFADPPHRLRKPEADPEKQTWRARDVIRNGDFSAKKTGWVITGYYGGTREAAARSGKKGDSGAYMDNDRNAAGTALLTQTLNLPGTVTSATLSLDWAVFKDVDNATIERFSIAVGTTGDDGLDPAAAPVTITDRNLPGDTWQRLDYVFTAADLKKLNGFIKKNRPIAFLGILSGKGMVAQVDNVVLKVDCEFTLPEPPGLLAFMEKTDKGYSLVVSTPDGSARETVFSATGSSDIRGLDWRPDGKALCFASDHEFGYSWWSYEIYELGEDGLRRISNGPSLEEIRAAARPTGSVKVRVKNTTGKHVTGFVYVRGGVSTPGYSLGPKDSATESAEVTVDDVSDLGDFTQYVCVRDGSRSQIALKGVDVKAGTTVTLSGDILIGSGLTESRISQPTYSQDGSQVFYESYMVQTMNAGTGAMGKALPGTDRCWDPAASPADGRVLYVQFDRGMCVHDLATGKNEVLVPHPGTTALHHPTWINNGSGFLYLAQTKSTLGYEGTNIMLYAFEGKANIPLTDVYNERLSFPALSPDGAWLAFIRAPELELLDAGAGHRELWVMKMGEPHIAWKIETKGVPAYPCWTK